MAKFNFKPNASGYNIHNALHLAEASKVAYSTPGVARKWLKDKWGFAPSRVHFFDRRGAQGFVAANPQVIIVSFRGTEPGREVRDILNDVNVVLVPGPFGKVHAGFYRTTNDIILDVYRAIEKERGTRQTLWVTGHSLGGGMAITAAAKLAEAMSSPYFKGVYTYGQPRTGDKEFAAGYDAVLGHRTHRFINNHDIVPRVPWFLGKYQHVGNAKFIDGNGTIHDRITFKSAGLDALNSLIKRKRKPRIGLVQDHAIDEYLKWIRKAAGP